jgi:hypothetical protein
MIRGCWIAARMRAQDDRRYRAAATAAAVEFTHGPTYEHDPFYCRFAATPALLS